MTEDSLLIFCITPTSSVSEEAGAPRELRLFPISPQPRLIPAPLAAVTPLTLAVCIPSVLVLLLFISSKDEGIGFRENVGSESRSLKAITFSCSYWEAWLVVTFISFEKKFFALHDHGEFYGTEALPAFDRLSSKRIITSDEVSGKKKLHFVTNM